MHFTIVEQPSFQARFDNLRTQFPLMDQVHGAITWRLGINPFFGNVHNIEGSDFYILRTTSGFGGTPGFWVLYKVDENDEKVHLYQITVATVPDE